MKKALIYLPLLIALAISFTPFYSISYVIVLLWIAPYLNFSRIFSSYFSRFILALLLLLSSIMMAGIVAWLIKTPLYPILVLTVFGIISYLTISIETDKKSVSGIFDKSDIIATVTAIVIPAIIFISFYAPNFSYAAVYQYVSNEWDNASHILMLETVSEEKAYVYGEYADVKEKTINMANSYPQAWHLSTAHLVNGFGVNLFDPSYPLRVLSAYVPVLLGWYTIGVYLLSRLVWYIMTTYMKVSQKSKIALLLFICVTPLILLISLFGALMWGFANYLGLMVFLILMSAMLVEYNKRRSLSLYLAALFAGGAGVLCWFLPFPAIVSTLVLAPLLMNETRSFPLRKASSWKIILGALSVLSAMLFQVAIFVFFSHVEGGDQLNETGGSFPVSLALLSVLSALCLLGLLRQLPLRGLHSVFITLAGPMIAMLFILYIYQIFSTGDTSYYLNKIAGLTALLVGIFAIPLFVFHLMQSRARTSSLAVAIMAFILVGVTVVGLDQSTKAINKLAQSKTKVTYETSKAIVNYLQTSDLKSEKLLVLTNRKSKKGPVRYENSNGELGNKVAHQPYTCVNFIVNSTNGRTLTERLKNLSKCADTYDGTIVVITNNRTQEKVRALNKSNIRIVNVK